MWNEAIWNKGLFVLAKRAKIWNQHRSCIISFLHINDSKRETKILQQRRLKCDHVFTICLKWFGYNETMRGPELFLHALDPILPSTEVPRLVHPNGVGLLSFFFFKSVTSQRSYTDPEEPSWIHALYIILKNGDDMKPLLRGKAHGDSRFYAKSNAWIRSFGLKIRKIETI